MSTPPWPPSGTGCSPMVFHVWASTCFSSAMSSSFSSAKVSPASRPGPASSGRGTGRWHLGRVEVIVSVHDPVRQLLLVVGQVDAACPRRGVGSTLDSLSGHSLLGTIPQCRQLTSDSNPSDETVTFSTPPPPTGSTRARPTPSTSTGGRSAWPTWTAPFTPSAALCPHQGTKLAGRPLEEGCIITCPRHGSRYDVTTGKCVKPSNEDGFAQDMTVYPLRVVDDVIQIAVD